jgi:DNA-binding transcriptional ArsR family regulator
MSDKSPLRYLENKGALRIIIFIEKKGEVILSDLLQLEWIGQTALSSTLNLLLEGEIIEERREQPSNKRIFSLTAKGEKIAEEVRILEKLLKE